MPKFPEPPPPEELRKTSPEIRLLRAGTLLLRIYFRGGRHPTLWNVFRSFGPAGGRFDHHVSPARTQDRAILYAATLAQTCIAEVFQASRMIDRVLRKPWLVGFRCTSDLSLLDLTGTFPTRVGASMKISSGPRPRARRWSRAFYEAHPDISGLLYPSSMNANRPALALYERAQAALPAAPSFHRALDDPALLIPLQHVAHELGYRLV